MRMRARVGEQGPAEPPVDGIEPLPRQRQQIAATGKPAQPRREDAPACRRSRACAATPSRSPSLPDCSRSSAYLGTAHSAALVGVGARASAARSMRVQSVSWPTAEMSGMALAAAARTTISSLKPHRSSRLPPPRATISTSGRGMRPPAGKRVEAADRGRHLGGAGLALHAHGPHHDAGREALREARQHVADDGAGRRGDDADDARQERQRLLPGLVEQALGRELLLALLQQRHQRADAGRLQRVDDDLVGRLARIGRDAPGGDHLQPFRRLEPEALHRGAPDHRVDLGLVVLQREVAVARGVGAAEARDLAAQPHVAVGALQRALDGGAELRHRVLRQIGAPLGILAGGAGWLGHELSSGFVRHRFDDT